MSSSSSPKKQPWIPPGTSVASLPEQLELVKTLELGMKKARPRKISSIAKTTDDLEERLDLLEVSVAGLKEKMHGSAVVENLEAKFSFQGLSEGLKLSENQLNERLELLRESTNVVLLKLQSQIRNRLEEIENRQSQHNQRLDLLEGQIEAWSRESRLNFELERRIKSNEEQIRDLQNEIYRQRAQFQELLKLIGN